MFSSLQHSLPLIPLWPVIASSAGALLILAALRVALGLRLSLYLVNDDSVVRDQSLIPVTFSGRKRSVLQCLRAGKWRDDVELTLMDYQSRAYKVKVTFGLWRRYRMEYRGGPTELRLGNRPLMLGRPYPLRSGMKLEAGGRRYVIRVLPDKPELVLQY